MKASYKALAAATFSAALLTGCMDTPVPTSYVIQTQLEGNAAATEAAVWGMPARMNIITISSSAHYDGGYSSIMHIRDVMTDDMAVRYAGGYDWYSSWSRVRSISSNYLTSQFIWNYYYEQILTTNLTIGAIDPETDNAQLRTYLGSALGYRAYMYLDLARMYEVLPTDFYPDCVSSEGYDIKGLTAPIVTEATTEEESRNNPRATHADMFAFIDGDLESAIALLETNSVGHIDKMLPDLGVVYGLRARAALWNASYLEEIENDQTEADKYYDLAATYARQAITTSGATPLTEAEWQDRTNGFNNSTFSSWMFAGQYSKEDDVVQAGGIRCFTSFCSNEQNFGYAAPEQGAFTEIGAYYYNRMNDRDFRKLSYVAPEGTPLSGREPYLDEEFGKEYLSEPYIALKFRPGEGNMDDYAVGAVVAYPLMRVEEMYFIEAEAKAHTDAAAGNKLLSDFMTTYRYRTYKNTVSTTDDVIEEIIFQKRMELWGEGQNFFDVKRLGYSITRFYNGTNFDPTLNTYNTNGRPAWMNFCIVATEGRNNIAVTNYNTPSCDGLYSPIN